MIVRYNEIRCCLFLGFHTKTVKTALWGGTLSTLEGPCHVQDVVNESVLSGAKIRIQPSKYWDLSIKMAAKLGRPLAHDMVMMVRIVTYWI